MKLSRKLALPRRKDSTGTEADGIEALGRYIDDCMMLVEKFLEEIRVAVNANESAVILASALPTPSREYRGKLIQLLKAPAAQDELWLGIQDPGGDTFIQVI